MKNSIENLSKPTPKKNVNNWLILTVLYTITIFINEQFSLIHAIGLNQQIENIIKMIGAFLYILITTFNFSKVQSPTHNIKDNFQKK